MSSITEKIIFGIHFVVSVSRPHNGVIRDDSDDKMKQFALTWYSGFVRVVHRIFLQFFYVHRIYEGSGVIIISFNIDQKILYIYKMNIRF